MPINLEAAMLREGSDSLRSTYNHHTRTITMVGKLSVITLLHEFAHALLGKREDFAQDWSINLFRIIYPRAFEGLASPYPRAFEGLDSPCGHVLMKGNDLRTIEAPVRTVAVDLTPLPLIDAECESA